MAKGKKQITEWKPAQLKRVQMFWYFMNERHKIYVAKEIDKKKWPWTRDPILKKFKFTNVFRQLDRVTQEWTQRYMKLQHGKVSDEDLLFKLCMFRLFNWPPTYDALHYEIANKKWNEKKAVKLLKERAASGDDEKNQIFTGAYIIPNAGSERPKIEVICEAVTWVYENRKDLVKRIRKRPSMEKTVNILQNIFTVGPFIAYEIACDLRFTRILNDATDINSWANPGPGAKRGIHRLLVGDKDWPRGTPKPNYVRKMRELLVMAQKPGVLGKHIKDCEWPFEMREIEHSLCEMDKYLRVKNGEGRPRSRYNPHLSGAVPWGEDAT